MKSLRKNEEHGSFARRLLGHVSNEAAQALPFVLFAYAAALMLRAEGAAFVNGALWWGAHIAVVAVVVAAAPSLASGRGRFSWLSRRHLPNVALTAAVLCVAAWLGASIVSVLAIGFACAAILFRAVPEHVTFVAAAVAVAAVPVAQVAGFESASRAAAVAAFDLFAIVVIASAKNLPREVA